MPGFFLTKSKRRNDMFDGILADPEFIYTAIGMLIIGLALHKWKRD